MEPIFLQPVLQEKIWGGQKLHTQFGMTLPSSHIGESWSISAHPNGKSTVISPKSLKGVTLDTLYQEHPEIFNNQQLPTFPLLVKILDATQELSVQVHPDDTYALEHEGELGKNECWYVISAEPNSSIIYGHTAHSKEELSNEIKAQHWDTLFTKVPVQAGDFFDVPSGTIHAIGSGIVILETQQNSDTTYRVYDYDRTDANGKKRELHIQQTIDVTTAPHHLTKTQPHETKIGNNSITHYITNDYFSVWKWIVRDSFTPILDTHYYLATVIKGNGTMTIENVDYPLQLADSFILPSDTNQVTLTGNMELIVSVSEQVGGLSSNEK